MSVFWRTPDTYQPAGLERGTATSTSTTTGTTSSFIPAGSSVLDVGGRKSWYTIGLPITVTVADLPREEEIQHELGLGVTPKIEEQLIKQRSNVAGMIYDDMAKTSIEPGSYDAIISVEVIEHVDDDAAFVKNMSRTIRPGGVAILTTPNGDRNPVPSGDHKRHYRRDQLEELLTTSFDHVQVGYIVAATSNRLTGLKAMSPRHPQHAARTASANILNRFESGRSGIAFKPGFAAHLIAVAATNPPT